MMRSILNFPSFRSVPSRLLRSFFLGSFLLVPFALPARSQIPPQEKDNYQLPANHRAPGCSLADGIHADSEFKIDCSPVPYASKPGNTAPSGQAYYDIVISVNTFNSKGKYWDGVLLDAYDSRTGLSSRAPDIAVCVQVDNGSTRCTPGSEKNLPYCANDYSCVFENVLLPRTGTVKIKIVDVDKKFNDSIGEATCQLGANGIYLKKSSSLWNRIFNANAKDIKLSNPCVAGQAWVAVTRQTGLIPEDLLGFDPRELNQSCTALLQSYGNFINLTSLSRLGQEGLVSPRVTPPYTQLKTLIKLLLPRIEELENMGVAFHSDNSWMMKTSPQTWDYDRWVDYFARAVLIRDTMQQQMRKMNTSFSQVCVDSANNPHSFDSLDRLLGVTK
ncbi:hypothetical protein V0288_02000 [Pannus brasiliensis CCIBt3594]|uniref:Uncharacterized protein n=1 Tax=Pannus brasiliensis CCIBt3594 TaxID=1427578 RepID=A0AAW9QRF8_9CHRO